jgi:hypothetical protein
MFLEVAVISAIKAAASACTLVLSNLWWTTNDFTEVLHLLIYLLMYSMCFRYFIIGVLTKNIFKSTKLICAA